MARAFHVNVSGDKRLIANLKALGARAPVAVEGGLFEWAETVVGDAKELAPVDLGNLRESGFVLTETLRSLGTQAGPSGEAQSMAKNVAGEIRGVMGFGGPAIPYALIQHERTDFHHTVGQAKYLQDPAQRLALRLATTVAARLQREVDRVARR